MYTHVMYGYPLKSSDGTAPNRSKELTHLIKRDGPGFYYPDYGDPNSPLAFGVTISGYDQTGHHAELSKVSFKPTFKDMVLFDELFDNLNEEMQIELRTYGPSRVFLIWETS